MKRTTTNRAVILVRVSTKEQETERQVNELRALAASKDLQVVEVIRETGVSGTRLVQDRPGLQRALEMARAGEVDKVLVHEVSRIARRNSVAHAFIDELCDLGVSLYWHQQGIETLLPNGKRNPAAAIMFSLLAEMARAERETLVERIRSGMDEAKRNGVHVGRPAGATQSVEDAMRRHADIVRALRQGLSVRAAAAATGKSPGTVAGVRKLVLAA